MNQEITRFTNHSCNPNCGLRNGLTLVALRDIAAEEEITIDYDTLEWDWEMECNCNSNHCRKKIRGYKYQTLEFKKRFKKFTSPYLLRIKDNGI